MNPQAYRIKLETAVEQRDQHLLDELERIAVDSPATEQLWEEHCLLEQAIGQWVDSPRSSVCDHLVAECLPVSSPEAPGRFRRASSFFATFSGVACLLIIGWIATNTNRTEIASSELAVQTVQEPSQIERGPFTQVSHSVDLLDQGKALLPAMVAFPVIPEVASQITEEVSQTWERISVLPEEMQQVWKQLNLPTTRQYPPAEEMPSQPKPARVFSFFNMLS